MDRLKLAISAIHEIDIESEKRNKKTSIPPIAKIMVTMLFIFVTVSFDKYDIWGLLGMVLYLLAVSIIEEISFIKALKRCRFMILILLFVGIANPFIDRNVLYRIGSLNISGGFVSMTTLFLKGVFAVCASYFLFVQIGINGLCRGLLSIKVPKIIITEIMLIYRYIILFLNEISRMQQAYKLRAPKQKGIHISSWGSFAGLILLRSVDRANEVYASMLLRGYNGEMYFRNDNDKENKILGALYVIFLSIGVILLRYINIFSVFK